MKTFYSIIKIVSNIASSDSISVGLVVVEGDNIIISFSDFKKKIAKKILTPEINIDFITKQIELKIEELNSEKDSLNETFFSNKEIVGDRINYNYFEYLSIYSQGIVQFTKPTILKDKLSNEKFEKLFKLFVDNSVVKSIADKPVDFLLKEIVYNKLISRVKEVVHTNIRLDNELIPDLIFPYELDCIGMNGSIVGAKSLSFSKSSQTIHNNITDYIVVR